MFNYNNATEDELMDHIEKSSVQTVSIAKAYHTKKGNTELVQRINQCREKLKIKRMVLKLEKLIGDTK